MHSLAFKLEQVFELAPLIRLQLRPQIVRSITDLRLSRGVGYWTEETPWGSLSWGLENED